MGEKIKCIICDDVFDNVSTATNHYLVHKEYVLKFKDITYHQWLVGMAMQGLCANSNFSKYTANNIADFAIEQADAVIKKLSEDA